PADGAVDDHLLVPDSIPEPATLVVLCGGMIPLLLKRKRKTPTA
ncbi:hypothetical protein LCGC14_2232420, partial [marine sediment metagenome]